MSTLPTPATIANFKALFSRDFVYGVGVDSVRDVDIQNALNTASTTFNPALFDTTLVGLTPNFTSEALIAYLNASAHFLVLSLQAVGGLGIVGRGVYAQGEGVTATKSASGLSLSMSYPPAITDSPALFQFTKTPYGMAYLQILSTKLVGNVGVVGGEPSPSTGLGF